VRLFFSLSLSLIFFPILALIIGVVVGVIVLLCLVIALIIGVIYWRRHKNERDRADRFLEELDDTPSWLRPIPLTTFREFVRKADERLWHKNFELLQKRHQELDEAKWAGVSKEQRYPAALQLNNVDKNRYINILPNERSRVKLSDDAANDYINANWIFVRERERYSNIFISCLSLPFSLLLL
jgi:hypothetical protein